MTRQTLALIAVLGLAAASLAAAQGNTVVEDWSKQAVGKTGIPDGWQIQNWGSPKYDFVIEADGPAKVLHMKSQNE